MARTHVALLRGINVGGKHRLPMADLKKLATNLGWHDVATHVASGNLVFRATGSVADLEKALAAGIESMVGKRIETLVLTSAQWSAAVAACPWEPDDERFVHVQVHRSALPATVVDAIAELVADADDGTEITINGRWLYLHTPHGLSKSVAFTKLPRLVPKDDPGTARNLRSSRAIAALLESN